ncbi:RagB/SusD family nutrient uptake outer membrane protein [Pedobacter frigoris]|uniref:RagB/SusD family nutrient uptake outer membrane protein n=1 Tax=Pedobacter frigoris TaxID=2571272 RepID=UPI00292F52FD|nr:RagB/SusD family nutrient uptake outer membrane protein [Pedobacter frigoris]
MKKILILTFALCTILMSGCKKYLDVKPKGYTIPEFYDDYVRLLNNQALFRVSSAYPNYLTDDVRGGDDNDQNKGAVYTRYSLFKRNLFEFKNGSVFDQGESDPFWEPSYSHIYVYNTIINNIEKVPNGSEREKKQLKAEALVGRAFEYLTLVNAYARHYDPATAATDLGVPLVLSEDINKSYKRNTVSEVYTQIKKDLEEALPNLATTVPQRFHPMKSVAYAFLSRMYLYMGNYSEALVNVKEALKLDSYLEDYNIYTTKKGTFGRVCTKANENISFPDAQNNKEAIWIRLGAASSGQIFAEVYASDDLLKTYRDNLPTGAVDQRLALFYCDGKAQFGSNVVLFPGKVLWAAYTEFNTGFSTPELYLIAAECEARVGTKEKSVEYLNTLRSKRIVGNSTVSASTNDEALKMALDERRREMPYLGTTRLVDLKRLNKDPRFAKTITHTHGALSFTLPANDSRYILPVPPKVLALNPDIAVYER